MKLIALPLLLVLTIGAATWSIVSNWNLELISLVLFIFSAIYIFVLEQKIPLKSHWKPQKRDIASDIKHLLFSAMVFDALGKSLALAMVLWIQRTYFDTLAFWNEMPFIVSCLAAIVIGEFLPYWYHRISHKGNTNSIISIFLWKVHAIHHIPTSLNWFKTNWIHPINMFLNTLLKITPLLLLGFSQEVIFIVGTLHVVIAYASHANIKTHTGFLDYVIVTPRIHQFHHSVILEEAKNFGNIIPLWDLVFGTYYNRTGEVKDVGVQESYFNYPKKSKYWKQLLFPFIGNLKECCTSKNF